MTTPDASTGAVGGDTIARLRSEDGSILALGWAGLAVTVVMLVLIVDLAAYLVAASRAQAAADAAALAAVTVSDPRGRSPGDPVAVARQVARANGATLVSCRCAHGETHVVVTVRASVHAIAATRFGHRAVHATAEAELVPPGVGAR